MLNKTRNPRKGEGEKSSLPLRSVLRTQREGYLLKLATVQPAKGALGANLVG